MEHIAQKILSKDKIDIVIHHACPDGFASAFLVWYYLKKRFGKNRANNVEYISVSHFTKVDPNVSSVQNDSNLKEIMKKTCHKNVLMCDFSMDEETIIAIINNTKSFLLIDHHENSTEDKEYLPECLRIYDVTKSSVILTWTFLYPNEEAPLFIKYIQDRDLWIRKLPNTDQFSIGLCLEKRDFMTWEKFIMNDNVNKLISQGMEIETNQKKLILEICQTAYYQDFFIDELASECIGASHSQTIRKYKKVWIICVNFPELKTDIGNLLLNLFPDCSFSMVYHHNNHKKQAAISLRSNDNKLDVSLIANRFGGGGHRNAAGFVIPNFNGYLSFHDHRQKIEISHIKEGTVDDIICKDGVHIIKPNRLLNNDISFSLDTQEEMYGRLIIDSIIRYIYFELARINDKFSCIGYVNCSQYENQLQQSAIEKYSYLNYFANYYFNGSHTIFKLYSYATQSTNTIEIEGYVTKLPYDVYPDYNLFSLLNKYGCTVGSGYININNKKKHYTLISTVTINENIYTTDYFEIIKKMYRNSLFLVFQTRYIDEENEFKSSLKNYKIFFNDLYSVQTNEENMMVKFLQLSIYGDGSYIEFTTEKPFEEINIFKKEMTMSSNLHKDSFSEDSSSNEED